MTSKSRRRNEAAELYEPNARRRARLINKERKHSYGWFYLSFANEYRFLGGVIVRAQGILTATERATKLGLYPGGEVLCCPISRKDLWRVPPDLRNRLLSQQEVLERLDGKACAEEPGAVTVYISR